MDLREVMTGMGPGLPNQNLIEQKKIPVEERPEGFWRMAVLDFASILSALLLGFSYFQYIAGVLSYWYLGGAFLFFSAASIIQGFVTKSTTRRTVVIVVEAAAITVPFVFYGSVLIVLLAWFITFLFLLMGYFGCRAEIRNEVEVQFFKASRGMEGKLVTGILLAMVVLYIPQAQGSQLFMSEGNFAMVYGWAANFMGNFYPGASLNGSFVDFSQSLARAELANNTAFATLSPVEQASALAQTSAEFSATVAKATGAAPAPNESVSSVLYRYLVSIIVNLRAQFQDQFILAWIVLLFIILRTAAVLAVWGAQLVTLVVYEILLALNFMHIEEETQTKEIVVY